MRLNRFIASTCAGILLSGAAQAATTTIQFGDEDCFGLGGTCPAALADTNTFDNSGLLDFPGTDQFGELGTLNFAFNYTTPFGMAVDAVSLSALVAGLDLFATSPANGGTFGDEFEGARFQLNGNDVGTYFSLNTIDGLGPRRIETVTFSGFDTSFLVDGANTITIIPEQDFLQFAGPGFSGEDAYAVDFVELSVETSVVAPPPPVVPLPASALLLGSALGLLGWARRKA